jgi:molecular chaperone DnaK
VEITLKINESRIITVEAYVPALDEEFEHQFDLRKKAIAPATIEEEFRKELERLQSLVTKAEGAGDEEAESELENLKSSDLVAEIKEAIAAAKGDPDAAEKAEKRLLEFKVKLDVIEAKLKWPALVTEVNEWLDIVKSLVAEHGKYDHRERFENLTQDTTDIIRQKNAQRLHKKLTELWDLYYDVLYVLPSYWVNQFRKLEDRSKEMTNQEKADHLYMMGRRYLDQNNITGLRNVVTQLWDLLPPRAVKEVRQGYGSTLTR